jgi:hypothetical protein
MVEMGVAGISSLITGACANAAAERIAAQKTNNNEPQLRVLQEGIPSSSNH